MVNHQHQHDMSCPYQDNGGQGVKDNAFTIEDQMLTLQVDVDIVLSHARLGIQEDGTFTIEDHTLNL